MRASDKIKTFRVYFNERKQWFVIHLHNVHPTTFYRYAQTYWGFFWGYNPSKQRNRFAGFFGEIHLVASRVNENIVSHELLHLLADWCHVRGLDMNNFKREEDLAWVSGELNGNFWRAYRRFLRCTSRSPTRRKRTPAR